MSEDVQVLRPWQIKDFPEDKRRRVTQAAYQAHKTVAAWMEPIIDAALDGEDSSAVTRANGLADSADVDEVCRLVLAACEFAQHRKQMQQDLAATISRRLQNALEQTQTRLPLGVNRNEEARGYPQVVAS